MGAEKSSQQDLKIRTFSYPDAPWPTDTPQEVIEHIKRAALAYGGDRAIYNPQPDGPPRWYIKDGARLVAIVEANWSHDGRAWSVSVSPVGARIGD